LQRIIGHVAACSEQIRKSITYNIKLFGSSSHILCFGGIIFHFDLFKKIYNIDTNNDNNNIDKQTLIKKNIDKQIVK